MKKHCTCKTDHSTEQTPEADLAQRLPPEDIRPGIHVAILSFLREDFPFWWGCESPYARPEPVRTTWMPCDGGQPLEVVAVCLPFVLAADYQGHPRMLDTRRHTLVRLSDRYARKAIKRLRALPKPPVTPKG